MFNHFQVLDGELYVVEMMFQKLTAKVQINSKTKELKEYEFQKSEEAQKGMFNSRMTMFLVVAGAPFSSRLRNKQESEINVLTIGNLICISSINFDRMLGF